MKTLSDNMERLHQEQTCSKRISKGHITGRGGLIPAGRHRLQDGMESKYGKYIITSK